MGLVHSYVKTYGSNVLPPVPFPARKNLSTKLGNVTTQKTAIFNVTAARWTRMFWRLARFHNSTEISFWFEPCGFAKRKGHWTGFEECLSIICFHCHLQCVPIMGYRLLSQHMEQTVGLCTLQVSRHYEEFFP